MLKFHMRVAFTALSGLAFGVASGQVAPDAGMLRWPDIGKDSICFVYANDIWIVPKEGGVASPLASPPGLESFPRFSPDETTIAFVGNYEGARDLYSIPVAGGIASRITHHPMGETLCDWTASGDLLFFGNGMSGLPRQSQMFSVGSTGGLPKRLPVPYSGFGSVSPDGKWLAYTPHSTDTRTWKRYRGGMATDIWLFNLENNTSKRITDWEGTDTLPMWVPGSDGKELLYLSDNGDEHRLNIWRYDIATGKRTQITKYTEFDVRWPSIGPGNRGRGEIVFQLGSELRVVDLASGKDRVVKVTIPGDRPAIRPRSVDASKLIGGASISPSGKRVVVQGRGDLFSVPAKEGVTRNMSTSNGVLERDPSWSPDGKWIAYFSDETGEYELWVRASDAKPEDVKVEEKKSEHKPEDAPVPAAQVKSAPRKLTNLGPGFRYNPMWSPDSNWIVFLEKTGAIQLVNVESGELKTLAIDPWANLATVSWSHDSSWIAFDLAHPDNALLGVWIYSIETHTATKVISEMFSTSTPAFDAKGDWLFVKSNRAVNSPIYSDLDTTFVYTGTEVIGAIPLRNDVKNPWAVKSDEEMLKKSDESKKEDENKSETVQAEQAPAQGIEGTWSGTATGGEGWPAAGIPFTLIIKLEVDGTISGTSVSALGQGKFSGGTFNKETGEFSISITVGEATAEISGSINGDELNGKWFAGDAQGSVSAKRVKKTEESKDKAAEQEKSEKKKEPLKIEFDGFEKRMIVLPITPGSMGQMAATEDNKLIFVRRGSPRGGDAGIKIFDLSDDAKEEKSVTAGGGFSMSADRKKLLVGRGSGLVIADAAAGGGKIQSVPTDGMKVTVDPKAEWRQIFNDAWR
ncbi:MAG: hypothetical protein ACK54H_01130, partial [Phycisphaerales bacterium]